MCSASGVDGWSLDIVYLVPLIQLDGEGTKKWQGEAAEGQLYMVARDQFSFLPSLFMPKDGLSEAVVWGRFGRVLCYIKGTTRPVIAGEKKIYKIYDSNQSGFALLYIQQLFSVLFSQSFASG